MRGTALLGMILILGLVTAEGKLVFYKFSSVPAA